MGTYGNVVQRILDGLAGIVAAVLGTALLAAAFVHLQAPIVVPEPGVSMISLGAPSETALRADEPAAPAIVARTKSAGSLAVVRDAHFARKAPFHTRATASSAFHHSPATNLSDTYPKAARVLATTFGSARVARRSLAAVARHPSAVALHEVISMHEPVKPAAPASVKHTMPRVDPASTPEPPVGYDPGDTLVSTDIDTSPSPVSVSAADLPAIEPRSRR